jgi:hypothetical protein
MAMPRDFEDLQARLDGLEQELRQVQERLDAVESRGEAVGGPSQQPEAGGEGAPLFTISGIPAGAFALAGRTLMVAAGAFFLRAITEEGLIPASAGIALGLVYAAWWVVQADRSARAGHRLSAVFHGFAGVLIAYPLIAETTTNLGILPPALAGAALVLFLVLGLAVAAKNELGEIAWAVTIAAVVTAITLLLRTHELVIFTVALAFVAIAVEVLAFTQRWLGLRWLAALALDLSVLALATSTLDPGGTPEGREPVPAEASITIALALPLIYLSGIGVRTLGRRLPIQPFEVAQAAIALLLGLGAAWRVILFIDAAPAPVAIVSLALGIACYATAFAFIDRRSGRGRNFYTYTTFAILLVLAGSALLLRGDPLAFTWSALALVAAGLGGRFKRITLRVHAAVYLLYAAIVSNLILYSFDALLMDPSAAWHPLTSAGMAVATVTAACYAILVATSKPSDLPKHHRLPDLFVASVIAWSVAGILASALAGSLIASLPAETGRAFVAASRTGVLAALAVALAWSGRRWSLQELTWLVYPVLVLGAGKLLWEDLRYGEPLSLFLSLAFYGGALFVSPRLLKAEPEPT